MGRKTSCSLQCNHAANMLVNHMDIIYQFDFWATDYKDQAGYWREEEIEAVLVTGATEIKTTGMNGCNWALDGHE